MALNVATAGRTITSGFLKGISEGWQPAKLNMLSRSIGAKKNSDDVIRVYGVGDLSLAERNAGSITYERFGAWHVDIQALDTFTKGIQFSDKDLRDLPSLVSRARQIPSLFNRTLDDLTMTMIVEGDATTYGACWDAVALFSGTGSGHTYTGDVSYKTAMLNLLQAAEVTALNISTATAPTAAEWQAALDGVWQYISANIKDTAGNKLFTGSESLRLMVPPNLFFSAKSAFQTDLLSSSDNVYKNMVASIEADSRLTDTAIWYLLVDFPGTPERPIWHAYANQANGGRYSFAQTDQTNELYVDKREYKWSVLSEEKLVYGDWRTMYRCVFS